IPFIGPFVATFLPTVFALVQFESWQMAAFVFLCLNLIQFVSGSYLEPRIAGKTLSVSPFMVLFAIFLWSFLWGIAGIFLAVPFLIAALTACAHAPSLRWVAALFSGQPAAAGEPPQEN
uniref:AI-2E family transporter n=1 Tax=Pseudoxanthobacter sp. TaxID=1925742 RepID=UPI002FDFB1B9